MLCVSENSQHIRPIMDALKDAGAEATWFLGGSWVQNNMLLAKEVAAQFEVGNHAYTHKNLTTMNEAKQKEEILNTHTLVKNITTLEMTLFTPPSGNFNKATLKSAENLGYKTIMWSKNTVCCSTADNIFASATNEPKNGDLIHMHPTQQTLKALPRILEFYKTKGFGIVKIGQIITS